MIVIRHGETYVERGCDRCRAILGYTKADIKKESRLDDVFGELHSVEMEYITCPECRKKNYLVYLVDGENTLS